MDLVSVIIPYHKKRNTVKETLISVINQSYENLEVLVIYDDTNLNDFEFLQKIAEIFRLLLHFCQILTDFFRDFPEMQHFAENCWKKVR